MKKILFVLLCINSLILTSQLKVKIGRGRVFCDSTYDIFTPPPNYEFINNDSLGNELVVEGGVKPYTYRWVCNYTSGFVVHGTKTASYFLNDTTIPNPKYSNINSFYKQMVMYLYVKDSIGNESFDSIYIRNTRMGVTSARLSVGTMDSLYYLNSNKHPIWGTISIDWIPKKNIVDSSNPLSPKVRTDTFTYYSSRVLDGIYCQEKDYTKEYIVVYYGKTNNLNNLNNNEIKYSTLINENSKVEFPSGFGDKNVELFDYNGKKIFEKKVDKSFEIGKIITKKGVYFMIVDSKSYKVIKE